MSADLERLGDESRDLPGPGDLQLVLLSSNSSQNSYDVLRSIFSTPRATPYCVSLRTALNNNYFKIKEYFIMKHVF